jgi:L-threonylcarbamoyladenylate synthase
MEIVPCSEESMVRAANLLKNGGVVVIPTDTVYGLAAHPSHPEAVKRLYTIKGREESKPIGFLAANKESVLSYGAKMTSNVKSLAESYWPGALTLVLECKDGVYEGFRVPNHNFTSRLLILCGGVLRVTSANLSGKRPATDVPQALAEIGLNADMILDDGVSPGGVPSTVVKAMRDGEIEVLRQGAIEISPDSK